MEIKILFEDRDMIVAVKPAGVPSQADKTGDKDMVTWLGEKYGENISVINRLDRPVSGIMVFGRNEKASGKISAQMQLSGIQKEYLAVVCGTPKNSEGEFTDFLLKNQKTNTSAAVGKATKNAKEAKLEYKVISTVKDTEFGELSLIKVRLLTGRHHQIRVQFSTRGLPIWGDSKYNEAFKRRHGFSFIGLCSTFISLKHPTTGKIMEFSMVPKDGVFGRFF